MFTHFFYNPLYNGLVFLTEKIPGHYLALSIIILTVVIKLILFPISKRAVVTQMKMKLIEPEMESIKEKFSDNKQEQARRMMDLYRNNKLNPFSVLFLAILQIPIFIALALIFSKSTLTAIDPKVLYSFVHVPEFINQQFLWINIGEKSVVLGAIAGILQFIQIRFSIPAYKKPDSNKAPTFKDDFARSMNVQMRFVMPVIVFFVSLGFKGALSLYWIVSTMFTIGQELYFRKTIKKGSN